MSILSVITVNNIYDRCRHRSKYAALTVDVALPWRSKPIAFGESALRNNRRYICTLITALPEVFTAAEGRPWIYARYDANNEAWCSTLDPARRLIELGVAIGVVRFVKCSAHPDIAEGEMPHMVIDEKVMERYRRNKMFRDRLHKAVAP